MRRRGADQSDPDHVLGQDNSELREPRWLNQTPDRDGIGDAAAQDQFNQAMQQSIQSEVNFNTIHSQGN